MPFDNPKPLITELQPLTHAEMEDYLRPFDPNNPDPSFIPTDYRKRYASPAEKEMYHDMDDRRSILDARYRLNTPEEQRGCFEARTEWPHPLWRDRVAKPNLPRER